MPVDKVLQGVQYCATQNKRSESNMITMHPGMYLKASYVEAKQVTQAELARKLEVSPAIVSRLLNGRADLSVLMALRLEKAFDRSAESWLQMQMEYDIERLRDIEGFPKPKRRTR